MVDKSDKKLERLKKMDLVIIDEFGYLPVEKPHADHWRNSTMDIGPRILLDFWPLVLLQVGLAVAALLDMRKRKEPRHLPKFAWIIIVILVNLFGPLAYFLFARGEKK